MPERELDTQLLLEGLVIVSSGLVVLVSGLLSEHAVGPIATFGAAMVGGAVWDVWRQFGRRQRDRSVL